MHRRLPRQLLFLLLIGLWGTACDDPTPPSNKSPVLTGPTAQATEVGSGAPVALTLEATDPDGDTLTFAWTQTPASPAGSFNNAALANPTWTSPVVTTTQRFTLQVTVSDGKGGTDSGTVAVDVAPPVPGNNAPTLTTTTATPSTLNAQETTSLSVTASDVDGDTLTYVWTQEPTTPVGSFSSTSVATPTWTAPRASAETNFSLRVTVSDGKGGTANSAAPVTVHAFVNSAPTLTAGPAASSTTVDEQLASNLSVTASDVDGDTLTYAWTQVSPASPVGTFSSASAANPTWTAPDVSANGIYQLRVTVSDGQGGSVQGTLDITVQKVNRPPTVGASITGPTTLIAGDTGTFSLSASDPDGDTLTWSWTQTDPTTQGTFVGSSTTASAQWFSPVLSAQTSFTFSVTVTDGESPVVTRTVTLPVTVPHYTDVQSLWNTVPCTGCHGSSGGLNLSAATSYSNLVNVTTNAAACATLKRVSPGDPDNSALIRKMEGTLCGTRMPRNNQTYFNTYPGLVVRVRSWILAGAAND